MYKDKGLIWLTVSEISVQIIQHCCLWARGEAAHHCRTHRRGTHSSHGSQEAMTERGRDLGPNSHQVHALVGLTSSHWYQPLKVSTNFQESHRLETKVITNRPLRLITRLYRELKKLNSPKINEPIKK
jgi:hypothetical protein